MTKFAENAQLIIGDTAIAPGETRQIELPVVKLYTDTEISMPIHIQRAEKAGPTVFVSAAVHGDELNGIEIIRRLLAQENLDLTCGTLICVPIVNVYGVLNKSRYMPDRRDLNRSFPGSDTGSLTKRVARQFIEQIASQCDYGIDLHTGAIHRSNLPQIRANLANKETLALAQQFNAPVLLHANLRDGSLRQCAGDLGCRILLYEAGEALRFDEFAIRTGVKGILNVLGHLGMLQTPADDINEIAPEPLIVKKSAWMRATGSGIVTNKVELGDNVNTGDVLANISNPFGEIMATVHSKKTGIVIGQQNIPLVQEGDAMFHIAYIADNEVAEDAAEIIEQFEEYMMPELTEYPDYLLEQIKITHE